MARSHSSATSNPSLLGVAPFLLISISLVPGASNAVSFCSVPEAPAPAPAASVVPETAPATPAATSTATLTTAGLPAALVALLRGPGGPFLANEVYRSSPAEPLAAIKEIVPTPEWYAITRRRFVVAVDQFALSTFAITGVAHAARKAYSTQALALDAFNRALT
ncbi:hypothetical protein C8R45DRAFT_1100769 [Mycena sanguinolenta]|nr:hypothetical protein C8R45DRAFT_1100769 [Mycena sanguinolenta]